MIILGFEIDVVNLRTETYALDSRIPQIEIGTAEEDALRRDFTINSMFYNINEMKVEDLSGNGLSDMENKVIRTPIDPVITLQDDPLRIMRAVRFASRLSFEMDDGLFCFVL